MFHNDESKDEKTHKKSNSDQKTSSNETTLQKFVWDYVFSFLILIVWYIIFAMIAEKMKEDSVTTEYGYEICTVQNFSSTMATSNSKE
ncbi:unnamed protein product [Clavelina lepadiformis]|uniref:ATP synthase F0 subunit 8 n=1 Tax=Clavelina lepadiformis TaxID=159417 RepID=A0ABP0GXB9_CLALP